MSKTTVAFCIAVAAASAANAASNYVVPWYANPATTNAAYDAAAIPAQNESAAPISTAWATVSGDANVAGKTILAKRMSHVDYFRPRLYVLTDNGTVVIYTLSPNLSSIVWTTVYTSADLIARVNHNGGTLATGQTVTALEIADADGAVAFVGFDGSLDRTALANKTPSWTYYAAGAAGNPSIGDVNCITDGRWVLKCYGISNGQITIGTYTTTDSCYVSASGYMGEYLDLSSGIAANGNGSARLINVVYSLKDGPRVILHSSRLASEPNNNGMQQLNSEELVIKSTTVTKIKNWSNSTQTRLFLDLPNLASVGNYGFSGSSGTHGEETDFADFHVPVLATVGEGAFQRHLGTGTLSLPSAQSIGNKAFFGCDSMEEALLAPESNTLVSLGAQAFAAEGSVGSLKRVTLGCADGFTCSAANAFAKQPLEVVTFTGAVPSFTATTAWPDTAANTMVFAIPEGVAAWDAIATAATPLSEAERKACHAAHPGWPIPFATVSASVFKTQYAQYIAYTGNDTGVSFTVERDTFYDDTVSISADWAPFADGTYPKGANVTLTATPNATGTFVKWYGDVEREDEENATITMTLNSDTWLYARIVHPWTLSADKTTMFNGNFTVNCSVVSESARTLQVGISWKTGVGGIYANADGRGVLDLAGPIALEGDGGQWTVVQMSSGAGAWAAPTGNDVTGILTPGTLTKGYDNAATQPLNGSSSGGRYSFAIIDEPNASWTWNRDWYVADGRLAYLVLRIPKMTSISGNYCFVASGLSFTKLDWWDLTGVSSIGANTLLISGNVSASPRLPASGTLSLPSFRSVAGAEFQRMENVEGFVLGGRDKATTVTNIAANAFAYDVSLRRLVLHADAGIVVGATPFANGRTPDEIVFTGAPPRDASVLANLLSGVAAGDAPVIVRTPKGTTAWQNAVGMDHTPTAAEKALAGDESGHVFGVVRGDDSGTPFVKALCIWDEAPEATVLYVR